MKRRLICHDIIFSKAKDPKQIFPFFCLMSPLSSLVNFSSLWSIFILILKTLSSLINDAARDMLNHWTNTNRSEHLFDFGLVLVEEMRLNLEKWWSGWRNELGKIQIQGVDDGLVEKMNLEKSKFREFQQRISESQEVHGKMRTQLHLVDKEVWDLLLAARSPFCFLATNALDS